MDSARSLGFTQESVPEGYERYMLRQLFEPWAADLVGRARLRPGTAVLDVASGLGPVARLAAQACGPQGKVVATDISAPMLALAASGPVPDGAAQIEYRTCPAAEIDAPDASFDVVLCQQGVQFFPDRVAALREMRRVTRPGGEVLVSVWAAEYPLGLFGPMSEALQEMGLPEPFPRAFDTASFCVGAAGLAELLTAAGWRDAAVDRAELVARWDSTRAVASTVLGTPFGPMVRALPGDSQDRIRTRLVTKLGGTTQGASVRTVSNIARAVC